MLWGNRPCFRPGGTAEVSFNEGTGALVGAAWILLGWLGKVSDCLNRPVLPGGLSLVPRSLATSLAFQDPEFNSFC